MATDTNGFSDGADTEQAYPSDIVMKYTRSDVPKLQTAAIFEILKTSYDSDSVRTHVNKLFRDLPQVDISNPITAEILFTPNDEGFTPLDNPRNWDFFPAICQNMAIFSNQLALEQLQQENRDGKSYLAMAMENVPFDKLVAGLHHCGIYLPMDPETLLAPDAKGDAILGKAHNWEFLDAICQELAASDKPLTLEHLLQTNRDGVTYLETALEEAPLDKVMAGLRHCGIYLRKDQLIDPETGDANKFLRAACLNKNPGALFHADNWQGANPRDVSAVLKAMPEEVQDKIPNRHQLVATLRQAASREPGRA